MIDIDLGRSFQAGGGLDIGELEMNEYKNEMKMKSEIG